MQSVDNQYVMINTIWGREGRIHITCCFIRVCTVNTPGVLRLQSDQPRRDYGGTTEGLRRDSRGTPRWVVRDVFVWRQMVFFPSHWMCFRSDAAGLLIAVDK